MRKKTMNNFERFWEAYPRKVGKKIAEKKFMRIPQEEHLHVIEGVEAYVKSGLWENVKYIPHPITFLNQERWEDIIPDFVSKENLSINYDSMRDSLEDLMD